MLLITTLILEEKTVIYKEIMEATLMSSAHLMAKTMSFIILPKMMLQILYGFKFHIYFSIHPRWRY